MPCLPFRKKRKKLVVVLKEKPPPEPTKEEKEKELAVGVALPKPKKRPKPKAHAFEQHNQTQAYLTDNDLKVFDGMLKEEQTKQKKELKQKQAEQSIMHKKGSKANRRGSLTTQVMYNGQGLPVRSPIQIKAGVKNVQYQLGRFDMHLKNLNRAVSTPELVSEASAKAKLSGK
jgi:hypothetical protein